MTIYKKLAFAILAVVLAQGAVAAEPDLQPHLQPSNLPPVPAPTAPPTMMQQVLSGQMAGTPAPTPAVPPAGVSPAMVGGATPSAPMAGHSAPAQPSAHNPAQVPTPSGIGGKVVVPIKEKASTVGQRGGFNSRPGGHPTYRDANGPI